MKYALVRVLPDVAPGGVTAGIDWASADHAVCVVDAAGQVKDRFTAAHDRAGIAALVARLRRDGAAGVAIERGDGVLVDALLAAGLTVVVISPGQVKNLRSRYGSSGAKDDRFDAFVLADTLRTDRARLRPLVPDAPATAALRAAVRARKDLIAHRVGACNQLRAHLAVAFPGAIGLFADLGSPVSLAFLAAFPSPQAAAALGEPGLGSWLKSRATRGNTAPASVLAARLGAALPGTGDAAAGAALTVQLAGTVADLAGRIRALDAQIAAQLAAHPDAHVFTGLPRAGAQRAARLLAEIGDCRARYPDPQALAGIAGVAPVTRRSGRYISHHFRWAVNRQLRDALCDFADGSRHASPWAAALYAAARARGKDHPHAVRITARAWVSVIWRCWQDGTGYDPAKHAALQGKPRPPGRHRRCPGGGAVTAAITAALHAAAAGLHHSEAGTGLLASHGGFLHRDDFTRFVHTGTSISDGITLLAWIDWEAVITALDRGQLPASGGEQRILRLAASIADGIPVSLRDAIPGLDHRNLHLVTTAIRHAAGQHKQSRH